MSDKKAIAVLMCSVRVNAQTGFQEILLLVMIVLLRGDSSSAFQRYPCHIAGNCHLKQIKGSPLSGDSCISTGALPVC